MVLVLREVDGAEVSFLITTAFNQGFLQAEIAIRSKMNEMIDVQIDL
jgi:hypothetical protein